MLLSVAARRGGSKRHTQSKTGALLAGVRVLVAARACGQSQADEGAFCVWPPGKKRPKEVKNLYSSGYLQGL